ncbi:MAG TPA: hypothetical protein DEP88_09415 [Verrucomicrobiales bacterium]|nr:hypothetical protein [Verrucomicrobiales bacterium]HCI92490.1 hypothetical protein [Verrucomicrobiales bacterium]HCL96580.1 hypothetical protein [Verrucomicrobiales bacterium]
MTKNNMFTSSALVSAAIAVSGVATAGDEIAPAPAALAPSNNGSWCDGFKTVGKFYSNDNDPFIQELKFFGRLQWQAAHINGDDVNGDSFSDTIDDYRRMRFGAQIKFLNSFKLKGNLNLVDEDAKDGGGREFGYQNWDQLKLSYSKKDVAGFDEVSLTYGRHKVKVGHESHTSSKKIKTVERSPLSNKIYDGRWTGFSLGLERGSWEGTLGYFSQDESEALGSISKGSAFYLSSQHEVGDGSLIFDVFYNVDGSEEEPDAELANYHWVASLAYERQIANWNLMLNAVYGDNGDSDYQSKTSREGNFYGLVIMPSTYLIEDKLEFAARYTYMASEEDEGIRTNSRYFRAKAHGGDVNSGRGDSYHSIYAGLNWYLCGQNSKIMVGAEYETLDTPKGDADATTLWTAYRMYF